MRVSLAAVGQWIRSLGRLDPIIAFKDGPPLPPRSGDDPEVVSFSATALEAETAVQKDGVERRRMRVVKHSAILSVTPAREEDAPMRLNAHSPEWLKSE